ncbi:MAG: acyl-CoA thioesterase II [Actinomycetota bacterium]|nr:acyl-CoA thioesterase II [Actinomycetota bacterium]
MTPLDEVLGLLDLERIELDLFRGRQPRVSGQRVFGGQVAAQALVAAARTVPEDRPVHSLHAYFLRPGDPSLPIVYEVDRIRDGRSFTTRRVVAVQHGRAIFNLAASFHVHEDGFAHQDPMPDVPAADGLPRLEDHLRAVEAELPDYYRRPRPLDLRYVGEPPLLARRRAETSDRTTVWMRADGRMPDDPVLHVCVVAYASDITLLETTVRVHGLSWGTGDIAGASLDHAMWFHEPFRADEWWLYDQQAPWTGHGRGLARGGIWTADGRRVASVVQEGLVRRAR